jgi:hypothetical protein
MTCVSSTTGSASTIPMRSRGGRLAASIHLIADKLDSRKPAQQRGSGLFVALPRSRFLVASGGGNGYATGPAGPESLLCR